MAATSGGQLVSRLDSRTAARSAGQSRSPNAVTGGTSEVKDLKKVPSDACLSHLNRSSAGGFRCLRCSVAPHSAKPINGALCCNTNSRVHCTAAAGLLCTSTALSYQPRP